MKKAKVTFFNVFDDNKQIITEQKQKIEGSNYTNICNLAEQKAKELKCKKFQINYLVNNPNTQGKPSPVRHRHNLFKENF